MSCILRKEEKGVQSVNQVIDCLRSNLCSPPTGRVEGVVTSLVSLVKVWTGLSDYEETVNPQHRCQYWVSSSHNKEHRDGKCKWKTLLVAS